MLREVERHGYHDHAEEQEEEGVWCVLLACCSESADGVRSY